MFQKGDKVILHDGTVHVMRRAGLPPRTGRRTRQSRVSEGASVRGFVRGALVDCLTGEVQTGDWHENTITVYGHSEIVRNFVQLAGSLPAQWFAIGLWSSSASNANLSTATVLETEYGLQSNSTYNAAGGSRANVAPNQSIAGVWTLSQSYQYASSHLTNGATVGALAQYGVSTVGGGSAMSIALFASSTKGTTQALNVTYNWSFGT